MNTETAGADPHWRTILGIRFFAGPCSDAVAKGLAGGLNLAPSGPGLAHLGEDPAYLRALRQADLLLTDSGLMVLMWNFLERDRVIRTSGLAYLSALVAHPGFENGRASAWVMPHPAARDRLLAWAANRAMPVSADDCYLAPRYPPEGELQDPDLVTWLSAKQPCHVLVCVGGGVQERLGIYLRDALPFRPAIHCIGAAIGFLTGDQIRIPMWADSLRIGWLVRCLSAPGRFVPRYLDALKLVPKMLRERRALSLR